MKPQTLGADNQDYVAERGIPEVDVGIYLPRTLPSRGSLDDGMKPLGAFFLAPVLGLSTWRGPLSLAAAILLANALEISWRGMGKWWLPVLLYFGVHWILLVVSYRRSLSP